MVLIHGEDNREGTVAADEAWKRDKIYSLFACEVYTDKLHDIPARTKSIT